MKLPYGQSNFRNIATQGFYYVDRTAYIPQLEEQAGRFLFYLRPRKFGKSLFISMLEHYYAKEWKEEFQALFGQYYIGANPTKLANCYLVLTLDFSGITTDGKADVLASFANKLRNSAKECIAKYLPGYPRSEIAALDALLAPADILDAFFAIFKQALPSEKFYILIDEYDHFANELIAYRLDDFREIVSKNGFVRKFFEVIKEETRSGLVERLFATGVSPLTLDSLTSGFNIGKKISTDPGLHEMMGFTETETTQLIAAVGVAKTEQAALLEDLRSWYNGYRFHPDAAQQLYNPNMLVYFAEHYQRTRQYPENLLDYNIASDYSKISLMLGAADDQLAYTIMDEALRAKSVVGKLTEQYSFERPWTRDDFVSLLFYLGVLTVSGRTVVDWTFVVPNFVVRKLYFDYFMDTLRHHHQLEDSTYDIRKALNNLIAHKQPESFAAILQKLLKRLSNRDARGFNESHVKVAAAALLSTSDAWLVRSETELERQYADLVCLLLPRYSMYWNCMFEFKYLKKQDQNKLPETLADAKQQLLRYTETTDIQRLPKLAAFVLVVIGDRVASLEEVCSWEKVF